MAAILVMDGSDKGLFLPLGKRPAVVGRDPGAELQLADGTVSRKHFQVRFSADDNGYIATDLRSGNGTHVNRVRISDEVLLKHGDEIAVGKSILMFSNEVPADRANALEIMRSVSERDRETMARSSDGLS